MTASKGNKLALKLDDPEIRQMAYQHYCAHISTGKSKESWKFEHPFDELKSLTHRTMEKYIAENPREFPTILKEKAMAQSFGVFEDIGMDIMKGKIRNASPETWKTFMRNKFGWDKREDSQETYLAKTQHALNQLHQD